MQATMWTHNILPIVLWLQMAIATPFVTNARTGVSYQGTSANQVEQFQNIFYAEDTSGANRFKPPVPYLPPSGTTVQAKASGPACPQLAVGDANFPFSSSNYPISENCLSLRIARPANQSSTNLLPVMVWVYGGGFVFGETYDRLYNPVGLIQESVAGGHPVIYVGVNFRVGFFGFAASKTLQDEKSENISLRDQRAALQWVKDNVGAFGGDPNGITLFGESGGGISTGLQLVAFGGKQGAVFQKAIIDSGSYSFDFSTAGPFNYTASVAQSVKCSSSIDDPVSDATLACLRGLSLDTLLPAALAEAQSLSPPYGIPIIHPIVDGDFIPDQPSRLILAGSFVKGISLINSWLEDDGSQFVPDSINSNATVGAFFSSKFGKSTSDRLLSLYPVEEFQAQVLENNPQTAQYYRASRIQRDILFACPAINLTREISIQSTPQSYLLFYNTTRSQPIWDSLNHSEWQIAHTSDVPYVFNEDLVGGVNSKSALQLSAKVSNSYSAFATSGNPSTPDFNWPEAWGGKDTESATVFVVGGPYGSGPATLDPASGQAVRRGVTAGRRNAITWKRASTNDTRSEALAQEKLLQRCAFIDSIAASVG